MLDGPGEGKTDKSSWDSMCDRISANVNRSRGLSEIARGIVDNLKSPIPQSDEGNKKEGMASPSDFQSIVSQLLTELEGHLDHINSSFDRLGE